MSPVGDMRAAFRILEPAGGYLNHLFTEFLRCLHALLQVFDIAFAAAVSRDKACREHAAGNHVKIQVFDGVDESEAAGHGHDAPDLVSQLSPQGNRPVDDRFTLPRHVIEIYRRAEDNTVGFQQLLIDFLHIVLDMANARLAAAPAAVAGLDILAGNRI